MTTETQQTETHEFQAEIRQLLDIVIHSLYTNREIFVRELISNSADALEKVRYQQLTHPDMPDKDAPLEIKIALDQDARTFTITDTGVGMTREELGENLGTIARSGTKAFMSQLAEAAKKDVNLIGQFGVGFYSSFMAADKVTVRTRSFHPDATGWRWESEGKGSYVVAEDAEAPRGTSITLHLREDAAEFAEADTVKDVIRRFSAFVPFPVLVGDERVNTVQAIWKRSKGELSEDDYKEFYQFHANTGEDPYYTLHFTADVPLEINALLYVPQDTLERMGFGQTKPGVDLYCRNVMIMKSPEDLLPEWMRFVKGVIESEDLPLNISRETLQDNGLVKRLRKVIVGKFLRFLGEQADNDAEKYKTFYDKFGMFLHEGVRGDFAHRDDLAKLLRFESSKSEPGVRTSLTEYLSRMKDGQERIYFLTGPSREAIENGPYFEAFRERDVEVLYTRDAYEDYTLSQLAAFEEKPLISGDSDDLQLPGDAPERGGEALSDEQAGELCGWIKELLGEQVRDVKVSKRLVESPAAATSAGFGMTNAMQKLMATLNRDKAMGGMPMMVHLEINPRHSLVRRIASLKGENEGLAKDLAHALYDTAMLAAGLVSEPQEMVKRLNGLLEKAAGVEKSRIIM
ncbi:MAG: molecular chaperone HtpG [Sumerlaeia bacterium]